MVSTVGPPTPPGLIASSPTARANQRCSRWGKCGWSMRRRTRKSSIDAVKRGVCTVLVDPESTLNEVNIGDTEKVVKNQRSSNVFLR